MITSGKVWEVLVNSVHLDFLQHLQESWLIPRVGCASPGTQPAVSLHSSLHVLVILCPFCLWNAPLPVVQLRTGPEPSQHSFPSLCIWNKCNCEGSILKAARDMFPPTWLWYSATQPSATVSSWSVGQVPALPVSSLYAQLADIGLCCWQLNCWFIPTCQKDWKIWFQKVRTIWIQRVWERQADALKCSAGQDRIRAARSIKVWRWYPISGQLTTWSFPLTNFLWSEPEIILGIAKAKLSQLSQAMTFPHAIPSLLVLPKGTQGSKILLTACLASPP